MPIYDYQCGACAEIQEVQHKISEAGPDTCVQCGRGPMTKIIGAPTFMLKGGGWYSDGYSHSKKAGETSGAKTPSESSSATTAS